MIRVLYNRFRWRLRLIKLSLHMFDFQISLSSDSKWVTYILNNFWNLNFSLKINYNDDSGTSTSSDIFLTDHALVSRK